MTPRSLLLQGLLTIALGSTLPSAYAQTDSKPETVRAEIGKPLQEAAELVKNQQFAEALAKIKTTDAVADRTPFENLTIDRMRGAAAAGAGDLNLAVESFQRVIDSGKLPPAEQLQLMEGITASYFKVKDYAKAIIWGQRYFKEGGTSDNMKNIVLQSQYLSDNFAGANASLKAQIQAEQQAGQAVPEIQWQILADTSLKLKDMPAYMAALEQLVQKYPKPAYWADMIARVSRQPGFSDRYMLDALRLQRAVGVLTSADDYLLMGELAMQANLPAEALSVLDEAADKSVITAAAQKARADKVRSQARSQAAGDQKALVEGEAAAQKAGNGTALVNIGTNYLGQKQFDKAATFLEQGIAKGGLKHPEEAKLHLGIALAQGGNKNKAAATFKSVQARDGGADLARLWSYVK